MKAMLTCAALALLLTGCGDQKSQFGERLALTEPMAEDLSRPRIADFSGDRFPDLLARKGDTVYVYPNRADSSFRVPETPAHPIALNYDPSRVLAEDIGASFLPDLAFVEGAGTLRVALNRSDSSTSRIQFSAPRPLLDMTSSLPDKGPRSEIYLQKFTITDLDGDGDEDLLGLLSYFEIDYVKESYLVWWRDESEHRASLPEYSSMIMIDTLSGQEGRLGGPAGDQGLATQTDVNRDGLTDLVHRGAWYENQFSPSRGLSFASRSLPAPGTLTDVTGDNHPDLLYWSDGAIRWVQNRGGPSSDRLWGEPHAIQTEVYPPRILHAADVDGNGALDLVTVSVGSGLGRIGKGAVDDNEVAWYPNQTNRDTIPTWGEKQVINEPNPHALADRPPQSLSWTDPGALMDRTLFTIAASKIYLHRLVGGSPFTGDIQDATSIETPDWDQDGDPDIAIFSEEGERILIFENLDR